jgi:hypothetical protein
MRKRKLYLTLLLGATALVSIPPRHVAEAAPPSTQRKIRFVKAYVIDDRLSTLRREPSLKSELIQRMHLGRTVYIIGEKSLPGEPQFYRVAITRRTRGWVHRAALAVAGRAGEDARIWDLIQTGEHIDRIALCRMLANQFPRSPHAARALLLIGDEAERVARTLTRRAKRRLASLDENAHSLPLRDYYLNDPALDRYNRLGVKFNFDDSHTEIVYDKQAYYQVLNRFPATKEAERSQKHLERAGVERPRTSR